MSDLTNILDSLDNLDTVERRKVFDRLAYQMSKQKDFTQAEVDVWDACASVSGEHRSLLALFNDKKYTRAKYTRKVDFILARLSEGCRNKSLPRTQHVALIHLAITCLGKWLKSNGRAIIIANLVDHFDDVPDALELAFPGYAGAKMLDLLVRFNTLDQTVRLREVA